MYNLDKDKMKEIPKKMEQLNNKVSDGVSKKMKTHKVLVGGSIVIVGLLAIVGTLSLILDNPVRGLLGIIVLGGLILSPELLKKKKAKKETAKKDKGASVVESKQTAEETVEPPVVEVNKEKKE